MTDIYDQVNWPENLEVEPKEAINAENQLGFREKKERQMQLGCCEYIRMNLT
jgi:hypothetical protein